MLNISKDETGYGLNIKILIILKMEDLVWIFIMNKDKDIRVAVSNYLLCFAEKPALSHIEDVVFIFFALGCHILL